MNREKAQRTIAWLLTLLFGMGAGMLISRGSEQPASGRPADGAVPVYASWLADEEYLLIPSEATREPEPTPQENLFAVATEAPQVEATPTGAPAAPTDAPATPTAPSSAAPQGFAIEVIGSEPSEPRRRVLIYHTHTFEAYEQDAQSPYQETEKWRTADSAYNMVRVGEELAGLLRGLGFEVVHDVTAFEPPDLNSAYTRSLEMLERRQEAGETYDLYIDLHRDAYAASQTGPNTVSAGGREVAKLMLLVGKGEGVTGAGYDVKPDWEANLQIAQAITDSLNQQAQGLCRDVCVKSGRFNQHVAVGCILIEAGNNRNTLEEVLASMPYLADAIAECMNGQPAQE